MPELAEVEYFRRQWNSGLGEPIVAVLLHPKARIFRGTSPSDLQKKLTGTVLQSSEARGKQMLFRAMGATPLWLGIHLGMTGKLSVAAPGFVPAKHDHLVLVQEKQALIFADPRLFGRVLFSAGTAVPGWWAKLPPELLSSDFTPTALGDFLRRRGKAPLKAILLMQERFPGVGNWMADEILWRAAIHPRQPGASLTAQQKQALYRAIRLVCRQALAVIGKDGGDPPDTWLFNHRWEKGGVCPKTKSKLVHATIGGRTTCWSPSRQVLTSS